MNRERYAEVTITVTVALPRWGSTRTGYAVIEPEADFRALVAEHAAALAIEHPQVRDAGARVLVDGRHPDDTVIPYRTAADQFRGDRHE